MSGQNKLNKTLGLKVKENNKIKKSNRYINCIYLFSLFFTLANSIYINYLFKNVLFAVLGFLIAIIPISEIVIQIQNYILNKNVKPTMIPKLDFSMRNS